MTETKMNAALNMLYLCGCVLTNEKPNAERLLEIDWKELYTVSCFHSLTALVCEGLALTEFALTEENQKYITAFQKAREKAARKNLMLDTERAKILTFMEQNGILYMPLKGIILKDMYPKIGLRQMADNDILFHEDYREVIKNWFVGQGYEIKAYGTGNHDVYLKKPIYNYEMHISLYGELYSSEWQDYYKTVKSRLVKDANNGYGYHFTDEDFYIYFLSHGFKHFDGSGNGLRFLCDLYIYLKAKESTMDFTYINRELQTLELTDFEKDCRELIFELFGDINNFDFGQLTPNRQEMLTYFFSSGTYGTTEQRIRKEIDKHGKIKYLLGTIFTDTTVLKYYHPIFRHKWLMPIGWTYRAVKVLFTRPGNIKHILQAVIKAKKK